jgi:hypothetical protein
MSERAVLAIQLLACDVVYHYFITIIFDVFACDLDL